MNVRDNIARSATYLDGYILVRMNSGVEIRFPVGNNPRLEKGSEQELMNIIISPFGLHWPDLNEDLSFSGLLDGNYGQK